MPVCPQCARDLEHAGAPCAACALHGQDDAARFEDATIALPPSIEAEPGAMKPVSPLSSPDDVIPPPAWSSRRMGIAALVLLAGSAIIVLALAGFRHEGRETVPVAEQASIIGNTSAGSPAAAPRAVHGWTNTNSARWVSNHRRSIAYELVAENTASAGQTRVRPVLVVRCLGNVTEAFVFTQWPAAIEPDDTRTTHISFDGDVESTERWLTADSRDALFAPDGVAFARRLAHTQTLRFGFTPHNGSRQTIEFHVAGFDAHVETVARLCRWK